VLGRQIWGVVRHVAGRQYSASVSSGVRS
jgi:hypothetical protein